MGLKHVVVTSVDRDDLPDRGAGHYAATIRALKTKLPEATSRGADARLPRRRGGGAAHRARRAARGLQPQHRDRPPAAPRACAARRRATTRRSGCSAARRSSPTIPVLTKSGIIVGLGETNDEVVETMRDLRAHGVDVVTIGQYLQPSARSTRRSTAGCTRTSSAGSASRARRSASARCSPGPLVRSSYRADEQRHAAETGRGAVAY